MAKRARKLEVVLTRDASRDLDEIWFWNAGYYDVPHADKYKAFLRTRAEALTSGHTLGRPVPTRPEFRYINIRRNLHGHGHVCIYRVKDDRVEILRFYHARQDWQGGIQRFED